MSNVCCVFDIAGDAMDIEEDGPSDPKIYISAPLVSSSRPQLQTPNQHTLIAEYGRPHHSHQVSTILPTFQYFTQIIVRSYHLIVMQQAALRKQAAVYNML